MRTYADHCEWDPTGWWVVTVPEVRGAVTQVRRLDQAGAHIAEAITLVTGDRPEAFTVTLARIEGAPVLADAALARRAREVAAAAVRDAEAATSAAVAQLRSAGFSYCDIGALTGITNQRAQQIAACAKVSG